MVFRLKLSTVYAIINGNYFYGIGPDAAVSDVREKNVGQSSSKYAQNRLLSQQKDLLLLNAKVSSSHLIVTTNTKERAGSRFRHKVNPIALELKKLASVPGSNAAHATKAAEVTPHCLRMTATGGLVPLDFRLPSYRSS